MARIPLFCRAQEWAKTPLWKRAEVLHRVASLMRQNAQPIADVLVKEVAKPPAEALTGERALKFCGH